MRNFLGAHFLVALGISPHLAAAATPSLSGTTIPSAAQIVDTALNTRTLSGGQAYRSGKLTPSRGVILLLYSNAYEPVPIPGTPSSGPAIAVFDPATGAVTAKIPGVMNVAVFSPDAQRLYGVGLNGIVVIDTATDVPTTAVANTPYVDDVAITPDGKHLYITDPGTDSVVVADAATYTISTSLPIALAGTGAVAIVPAH